MANSTRAELKSAQKNETPVKQKLQEAYRQFLTYDFIGTLVIIMVVFALLKSDPDPSVLIYVVFAGVLGAFFSALMRLYRFDDLPRALIEPKFQLGNWPLFFYSLVPPIIGALGATILYIAFGSGLIEGQLFPKFECHIGKGECKNFGHFVQQYGPEARKTMPRPSYGHSLPDFRNASCPIFCRES